MTSAKSDFPGSSRAALWWSTCRSASIRFQDPSLSAYVPKPSMWNTTGTFAVPRTDDLLVTIDGVN